MVTWPFLADVTLSRIIVYHQSALLQTSSTYLANAWFLIPRILSVRNTSTCPSLSLKPRYSACELTAALWSEAGTRATKSPSEERVGEMLDTVILTKTDDLSRCKLNPAKCPMAVAPALWHFPTTPRPQEVRWVRASRVLPSSSLHVQS